MVTALQGAFGLVTRDVTRMWPLVVVMVVFWWLMVDGVLRRRKRGYYLAQTLCALQIVVGTVSVRTVGLWAAGVAAWGLTWSTYFYTRRGWFGSAPLADTAQMGAASSAPRDVRAPLSLIALD